jgi:prepilin-type N-terminal cleavage/methylation domain-containing protein
MVNTRDKQAGFTLTELMVVVVILSLLAAISTPLFTKDNNARRGRDWAKAVAQTLQRARFQSLGDRANIHVMLYRTRIDMYRESPPPAAAGIFTLLSTTNGPAANATATVAIWDAKTDGTSPTGQNAALTIAPVPPTTTPAANEIIFTPLGGTYNNSNWQVFVRNEILPSAHPDASFSVTVGGLTGFISSRNKVTLP